MTYLQQWLSRPQTVWLRKAMFQVHLWSGLVLGLYVFLISVTGSVLVYRNELYRAATPEPVMVVPVSARLSDAQLKDAAVRAYPGYQVRNMGRPRNPDQAVSISLDGFGGNKNRLFNPYTGADLGDAVPLGILAVSRLLELHDDLLGGATGRKVNAIGALLLVMLTLTGMVVWWPGIATWRRSLIIPRKIGWPRFIWGLHGVIGFWSLAFIVMFGVSGIYLGNPEWVQDIADWMEPVTDANARSRIGDQVIYWLAYLHVGRINGIGLLCSGPGVCDMTMKLLWAGFGLAPALMFVTGVIMWWNRVLRKKLADRGRA